MKRTRRDFLTGTVVGGLAFGMVPNRAMAEATVLQNRIPSSNEPVPAVGLGSWITFNVGSDPVLLDSSTAVMKTFFEAGGTVIDSSPMYGSSQATIGYGLETLNRRESVFGADKVWTNDGGAGRSQIDQSAAFWRIPRFDLVQVHNLVAWPEHLETLRK